MRNLLVCFMLSLSLGVFAQGDTGDDPDFPDVPLDGGLSILVAAGAAYGVRRVIKSKQPQD